MKIIILILHFSIISEAHVIFSKPSASLNTNEIKNVCKQMSSNHLEDIQQLDILYKELRFLNANNDVYEIPTIQKKMDRIHSLVLQIKETTARIRYLLKPEWNIESIPLELVWEVPLSLFYNDSQYLDLKKRFKNNVAENQESRRLEKYLQGQDSHSLLMESLGNANGFSNSIELDSEIFNSYITFNKNSVSNKQIEKSFFLNSENQDIKKFLFLNYRPINRSEYDNDRSFLILYKKNVTLLEACQFLNTLVFDIDIHYNFYALGIKILDQKKINLIHKSETPNEIF